MITAIYSSINQAIKRARQLAMVCILSVALFACGGSAENGDDSSTPPSTPSPPSLPMPMLPNMSDITLSNHTVEQYAVLEMRFDVAAVYNNPFDQREIDITFTFSTPEHPSMTVAAFWDEQNEWQVRFTPPASGEWTYTASISDMRGTSAIPEGQFTVVSANNRGMIKVGNKVDPNYSPRYLAYQNGAPFYGVGHGDVFSIFRNSVFRSGAPRNDTLRLIDNMNQAGENYVLWWPQFYFSMVADNYDNYRLANILLIDTVLETLASENKIVVFTIWDHSQLRDAIHPWPEGNWDFTNGFSQLTTASDFFTDAEAWAWQTNLYRYIIARWGHSNALGVWQLVSEIDGTNAFENSNEWHEKINAYFVANDPYGHITSSSMAGDRTWDEGHAVMDMPQVHIYEDLLNPNNREFAMPIQSAQIIADYTTQMWTLAAKPNWIGEFGIIGSGGGSAINTDADYYPELFHNAIWAALASGAAMTPAEWNDFDRWGIMSTEMKSHMAHLSEFVKDIPLVQLKPLPLLVSTNDDIKAWALAGENGGLLWIIDIRLQGLSIAQIRQRQSPMASTSINVTGLQSGRYRVTPFNTWQGTFEQAFTINCVGTIEDPCEIIVPDFLHDSAFKIERIAG